jgi:hypothetical protein
MKREASQGTGGPLSEADARAHRPEVCPSEVARSITPLPHPERQLIGLTISNPAGLFDYTKSPGRAGASSFLM